MLVPHPSIPPPRARPERRAVVRHLSIGILIGVLVALIHILDEDTQTKITLVVSYLLAFLIIILSRHLIFR